MACLMIDVVSIYPSDKPPGLILYRSMTCCLHSPLSDTAAHTIQQKDGGEKQLENHYMIRRGA